MDLSLRQPLMPDFARGTAVFTHTIDSAMQTLEALGIAESRITLRMAGPSRRSLEIVRQFPAPGVPLTPSVTVTLWISGFGFFDSLPMPMRESGGEAEFGTRELCVIFDDPLQKAGQWARAGAPLFRIGPEKFAACRRWLSLFGIDPVAWPEDLLYPLSLLAPSLASTAGSQAGIRLAFRVLLGLPVYSFQTQTAFRHLDPSALSHLGVQASRLGRDFVAGDRQLDIDSLIIHLGPVPLDVYTRFQSDDGRQRIRLAAAACLSAWQSYRIAWLVGDAGTAPHLGIADRNSRVGLNFYLGKGIPA